MYSVSVELEVHKLYLYSSLKKMNEKKQVFNMYKTQKAKEEKVSGIFTALGVLQNFASKISFVNAEFGH